MTAVPPVALVTGSGRRLGAAIAARLAAAGHAIALHGKGDGPVDPELAQVLSGHGHGHAWFAADLASADDVAGLIDRVSHHFGRPVDVLVNNASQFSAHDGDTADHRDILTHVAVNMAAPVLLAQAVAAGADAQRGAAVVNILDQRIAHPPRDQLAYTLSKQALAEATRTLAITLAPRVRVNAVAPGLTLPTEDYSDAQMQRLGAMMPLGRLATPQDIADAVLFLVQARAVTGQTLFVDGGAAMTVFDRDFVHMAAD